MDLRMTNAERMAFLVDGARVGVLSIEAPDRGPVSSPIWYTVESDRAVAFSVGATSQKAQLLRAAGRATLCVQSETAPYSYVSLEGAIAERAPSSDDFRREMAHRYLGTEFGEAYFDSTRDEASVTFTLQPQRWASVDYSKAFA